MPRTPASLLRNHPAWGQHPLAQRARWKVLMRWLKWQMYARVFGKPVIMPWINDTRLIITQHEAGTKGNYYLGLLEFYEMGFLLHFLRNGDGFADIGANAGAYTVLASFACGAHTIAFEAVPATWTSMQKNLAINEEIHPHAEIEIVNKAIGDSHDPVTITSHLGTMNRILSDTSAVNPNHLIQVPQTTLDNALTGRSTILWKIDVEGYEDAVVRGAMQRLADSELKAVIIEYPSEFASNTMQDHGFEALSYDPFQRQFTTIGGRHTDNVIWIRDRDFCQSRVTNAPSFTCWNYLI